MTYEPLHHKYRPQTFADLVGQEAIATTLTNAIRTRRIAPAYLFTGPRGTGKTSSARILAKSLNCLQSDVPTEQPCGACIVCAGIAKGATLDVIEIDAASNTGVDNIREIIERAQFAPVQCRYKVYTIDEVHMLSTAAFNALLKTLEEPPNHVVFVLATTDPQRVLPTIISRCQRFDFRRIPLNEMVAHLGKIAKLENINISAEALQLVAQVAQGGLRDAESLLDQLSLLSGQVTVEKVWDLVGAVPERDLMSLLQAISADNAEAVIDTARHLMDRGREPLIVLQNLAGFYRDLLIAKTAPSRSDLVAVTAPTWTQLCEFEGLDIPTILAGQKCLKDSELQLKNTTQPRLWLEMTLLGLLPSAIRIGVQESATRNRETFKPSETKPRELENPKPKFPNSQPPSPAVSTNPISTTNTSPSQLTPPERVSATPSLDKRENLQPSQPVSQPGGSSASQSELEQVWQQVLGHLPIPSKALFTQHGYLLGIKGQQAQIGIRSRNLFKMAQSKLSDLETAFLKAFHQKIKVILEVAGTTNGNASPTQESRSSSSSSLLPPTPEVREESAVNYQAIEKSQPNFSEIQPQAKIETFKVIPTAEPPTQPIQTSAVQMQGWETDEVMMAAKRLVEYFKGEIVQLSEEIETVDLPSQTQPITTQYAPPPESMNLTNELLLPEEEDDIPF